VWEECGNIPVKKEMSMEIGQIPLLGGQLIEKFPEIGANLCVFYAKLIEWKNKKLREDTHCKKYGIDAFSIYQFLQTEEIQNLIRLDEFTRQSVRDFFKVDLELPSTDIDHKENHYAHQKAIAKYVDELPSQWMLPLFEILTSSNINDGL
jgi:hypothetical protein